MCIKVCDTKIIQRDNSIQNPKRKKQKEKKNKDYNRKGISYSVVVGHAKRQKQRKKLWSELQPVEKGGRAAANKVKSLDWYDGIGKLMAVNGR